MSFATTCTEPTTAAMQAVGFDWFSLEKYAAEAIHALQTSGDSVIDLIHQGFVMWAAISGRDLAGIMAAFASGQRDVNAIIAAIKAEFGL